MRELFLHSSNPASVVQPQQPPDHNRSIHLLYFGLAVVGVVTLIISLYKLIVFKCCRPDFLAYRAPAIPETTARCSCKEAATWKFLSSFKYAKPWKKDEECAICLSVFQEGEEVKQLPNCKHVFHASCIDKWHTSCPLCRSTAELLDSKPETV